jgi:hypothetical protein
MGGRVMTADEYKSRFCAKIADRIVPEFREASESYNYTGQVAKRWEAAYKAAEETARIMMGD